MQTQIFTKHGAMCHALFSLQLAIGHDRSGEQTAELLHKVFGRLAVDLNWRPQLADLLNGLDGVSPSQQQM